MDQGQIIYKFTIRITPAIKWQKVIDAISNSLNSKMIVHEVPNDGQEVFDIGPIVNHGTDQQEVIDKMNLFASQIGFEIIEGPKLLKLNRTEIKSDFFC